MNEAKVIEKTQAMPGTVDSIVADLQILGVERGMTVLVHSSLSAMGWICGGAQAVILALEQAIGKDGTLVMPTHSGGLSDPADWINPPVPETWWQTIRETMPAFDGDLTPTRSMGTIPETFRKQQGVVRSNHPQVSFAAWGKHRMEVIRDHALHYGLGEQSPLGRIYDMGGYVLLLDVNHGVNTSLHLGEFRAKFEGKAVVTSGAPIVREGKREWVEIEDYNIDAFDDFEQLGEDFVRDCTSDVAVGNIGEAKAQLFLQRKVVDYAVGWLEKNR